MAYTNADLYDHGDDDNDDYTVRSDDDDYTDDDDYVGDEYHACHDYYTDYAGDDDYADADDYADDDDYADADADADDYTGDNDYTADDDYVGDEYYVTEAPQSQGSSLHLREPPVPHCITISDPTFFFSPKCVKFPNPSLLMGEVFWLLF